MEQPTKTLTNCEYMEYLKLKDAAVSKKPSRLTWFLLGLLMGILITVVASAILSRMNMIWFLH